MNGALLLGQRTQQALSRWHCLCCCNSVSISVSAMGLSHMGLKACLSHICYAYPSFWFWTNLNSPQQSSSYICFPRHSQICPLDRILNIMCSSLILAWSIST